jgi:small-conductance mechanosensitive channel
MIRLAQPMVSPALLRTLLVLGALFALDTVRQALAGTPLLEQVVLIAEMVSLMAALQRELTVGTLKRVAPPGDEGAALRLLRAGAGLALTVLGLSVALTASGYLRFSRLLTSGLLVGGMLALAFFTALLVTSGLAAFGLRSWPLCRLRMVNRHSGVLERRIYQALALGAAVSWLVRFLDYIGLLSPAQTLAKALLTARLDRGEFSLSLGNILAFALTLGLAFLLSAFLRFLLQEELFPRIRLAAGVSYAVSRLLHYGILAAAFLLGLGELGISLNRVVIFASALGVGIGFGL